MAWPTCLSVPHIS